MNVKLLILTAHYPPDVGAASVRMSEMVRRLSEDHDIKIIKILVLNHELKNVNTNHWIGISEKIEIFYVKYRLPSFLYRLPILNPFTLIEGLIAIFKIKDMNPDFIISSAPPPHPVILAYVCSKLFKSRYLVDIRDDWDAILKDVLDTQPFFIKYLFKPFNFLINFIFISACKNASLISSVHETLKDKFAKLLKVPIIVVPNGINNQELLEIKSVFDKETVLKKHNIQFNKSTKFLIYAGGLGAHYYRPEIVLDALQGLISSGSDFKYILVGEGNRKEEIARLAEKKGIKEHIYLLGRKSHSESLELMLASDIAIYSLNKNDAQAKYAFGLKVFEYIACELPILSVADYDSAVSLTVARNKIGISLNWDKAVIDGALKNALLNIIENYTMYSQNCSLFYRNNLSKFDRAIGLNVIHTEMSKIYKKK